MQLNTIIIAQREGDDHVSVHPYVARSAVLDHTLVLVKNPSKWTPKGLAAKIKI